MARPHDTMMNPPIESLLDRSDSKFTLVTLAAKRARQINSYFNQLGDGLGAIVPPQVASVSSQASLDRIRGDLRRQDHLRASRARKRAKTTTRRGRGRPNGEQPSRSMAGLTGRRIVLGVTGGIAAYKAIEVCRRLVDLGAHVVPIMTRDAHRFVGETTFSALASEPVHTSLWDDARSDPAHAPRSVRRPRARRPRDGSLPRRLRRGPLRRPAHRGRDRARGRRCVVCPAMHTEMWEHASVQENLATLRRRGVLVVEPESGRLAGGDIGSGGSRAPRSIVEPRRSERSRRRT